MEEQLISEIERRPVLYDRSVQACKKMSARDDAWREVAEIMKQTEPEVKKRWRTLRDSFMRFHRLQRTSGPKGKKKMWIYYHEMAFLIPHIEPREYKMAGYEGNEYEETMDNSRQEPHPADMVSITSDMCETELTTPPIGGNTACPCYNGGGGGIEGPHSGQQEQVEHGGDKRKRSDEWYSPDSDEHFALSCVAALRRLTARKNAEIRMRILHMLYEAEYGEEPVLQR
ncbi:transcription factor Adf-1-like [Daktulosphaira vitifoliae]|uniref:transcription factor Adf-1-like n=1 Tax=Daktulosphaira vitifoliae TaxID=58002 RepID=UPI0021A99A35|nr:transcription factor Adf-1-like [Daktulosphaira vitifoliae]